MAKVKKFGTFSGVFTPSILTILGVIMYLRFPAIIGQAGLINTIGIIFIAHIISITTSLSVASLSTDKPVQNGGTYFMISRSLGLPIGGTLGWALFVGLSFSVSLYLIGFAESFLQYWGMDLNINTIRLTGSIVLLAVTTITFISTSLAIKSQYFIMAAIALSLISIFFGKHDFAPEHVNLTPLATSAPFMILFGIFFPAVTGFEAGVSMSGDLQNPKKSLPYGAMLAVGVGFIVYIGLAFFYAFTVDANALVNDPQILFKISLVPVLVIAGIWGATLSSALGSILGAPRILQAIAMDKIAPKSFAKGTGKTNEPRNALLLAFIIAEAGILIGELDVIARIVSMFFITTYAFLNMASAIESWSSSDFRPAFKIPRFVSILGALSAFFVMILLDFVALAGATVVLGLLYFYLQRKELILESGDAWSSFWTNLAKRALLKLSIHKDNKRNWRPNIILFSGGEKARPHLVQLGLALSGKLGALTDFNLTTSAESNRGRVELGQVRKKKKSQEYFTRQLECHSLREGIKTVTNIYGFSGFEPNTVLLGWSKSKTSTDFLTDVLKDFKTKKLNAIFLDYDKNNGFGKKDNIDIWWNGKGRHLSFSLNILRFLLSDPAWRDAKVRIMIINSDTSVNDSLFRNTNAILVDKRIEAEIKLISDDFGTRSKEEIINAESTNADLILLGLSQRNNAYSSEYIEKVNNICKLNASIILLSPSDEFEETNLIELSQPKSIAKRPPVALDLPKLPEIDNKLVRGRIEKLDADLMEIGNEFCNQTLKSSVNQIHSLAANIHDFSIYIVNTLKKELHESGKHEYQKVIDRNHINYLRHIQDIIKNKNEKNINETEGILQNGISLLLTRLGNYKYETKESITIPYQTPGQEKEKVLEFPFRKAISYYIEVKIISNLNEQLALFEDTSKHLLFDLRNLILEINDQLEILHSQKTAVSNDLVSGFAAILNRFELLESQLENKVSDFIFSLNVSIRNLSIKIANGLSTKENLKKSIHTVKEKITNNDENLLSYSETWGSGMSLLNNTLELDVMVLSKKILFKNIIAKGNSRILTLLSESLFSKQDKLIDNLKAIIGNIHSEIEPVQFPDEIKLDIPFIESYNKATRLMDDFPIELSLPEVIYEKSDFIPFSQYSQSTYDINKSAYYHVDVSFHEPLYRDIENLKDSAKKAIIESKEANSMLLFHQSNIHNDPEDEINNESDSKLFKNLLRQIEDEKIKVETVLERIQHYTESYINEAFAKLFYHSILESGSNIHSGEREQKGRKFSLLISNYTEKLKNQFNNILAYFLNSTSSGILLSKKYLEDTVFQGTQNKELLDLVDQLLPDRKIYRLVPVFYRKLMNSSSKITDEFWIPRHQEMQAIKEAYKRHKNGFGGAVFITGVHGAGKTTLTRYAVSQLFKPNNTIWIDAPIAGSTNPHHLLDEFNKQTGRSEEFSDIFSNLPFESVVVINDLELWWERRPVGGESIDQMINIIKLYSQKVFFILNCNSYAYKIMQQIYPLGEFSLATVQCSAFNAKELQQMILNRHKSSGIGLSYHGKQEETISSLTLSLLFNSYFNVSDGIPGVAINTWKSNIRDINSDIIVISSPKKVSPEILFNLSKDWLMILALFIQHKNIDANKLSRIIGISVDHATGILLSIANAGLIVKKLGQVYTIGRNIEPLMVEVCKNKGLI